MFKKIDAWIRKLNHRRIDFFRALKQSLAIGLFPIFSKSLAGAKPQDPVLVLRLDDKIGDSVTATGFLYELKRQFPESPLIVLAGQNTAFLYQFAPWVDEVHVVKKGVVETLKVFGRLRGRNFRAILNTSHILTPQVIFLVCALRAGRKVGFQNAGLVPRVFSDAVIYQAFQDHVTRRYQKTLSLLGLQAPDLDYRIESPTTKIRTRAASAMQALRKQFGSIVVLNSFAGARLRNFSQETTTEIVKGLLQGRPDTLIVSLGSADDIAKAATWIKQLGDQRWIFFPGENSLEFNLEILRSADLVITPDTSFVHLASAFKRRLVSVYREDEAVEKNSRIWAPYKTMAEIVYAPFDPTRPYDINTLSTPEVVQKSLGLLDLPN